MDTVFFTKEVFDRTTCGELYTGLLSVMLNFHQMFSKASTHIVHSYQNFLRCDRVPLGLHHDKAPEEAVQEIIDINRKMLV